MSIKPPDGYEVEWGQRDEDGRIIWLGTDDSAEEVAREYGPAVFRYIGPTIPLQEGDDEPHD